MRMFQVRPRAYRWSLALFLLSWTGISLFPQFPSSVALAQTDLQKLEARLKNPDPVTRRKAAHEIGDRRFREAAGNLAEAARSDSDPETRAEALLSLGKIKDPETIPTVADGTKDTVTSVRRAAVRALISFYIESEIGFVFAERKGLNVINPFLETEGSTIVEPYTQVDPRILDALASVMRNDADLGLRRAGVRALGVLRANTQVPALASALQTDPELRIDVLRVFIKLGDPENGVYAVPYFDDENREVRAEAIFTAGYLRTTKAVERLNEVYNLGEDKRGFGGTLNDFFKSVPERQKIALESLASIGDPSSKGIFDQNLRAIDDDRRRFAYEGIARMGDRSYLDDTSAKRLTESSNKVRLAQAFVLYKFGRREYMLEIVKQLDSITLGGQARSYLPDTVKPTDLTNYLTVATPGQKVHLLKALGRLGTSENIPAMEPMLREVDERVVNAANLAIQLIKIREQYERGELPKRVPELPADGPKRPRRTKPDSDR